MDRKYILLWVLFSLAAAFFISPFASSSPDGLEKVAEDKGFLEKGGIEPVFKSPIPDYTWPGIHNESIATGLSGVFGTIFVFGAMCGIGALIKKII